MSKFELSFNECLDVICLLESSISDLKDVLSFDTISDVSVKEIMFNLAVDRSTLLLKLRSYVDSYVAACKA